MSQIEQLTTRIKLFGYLSYNQVKSEAENINSKWRESSWTRALRKQKDIRAIKPNGVIIGYEAIEVLKPLPVLSQSALFGNIRPVDALFN